jgi:S1-C subfamily serine protease
MSDIDQGASEPRARALPDSAIPPNLLDAEPDPGAHLAGQGEGGAPPPPPTELGASWPGWAEQKPNWAPPRTLKPPQRRTAHKAVALLAVAALLVVVGIGVGHALWPQGTAPTSGASAISGRAQTPARTASPATGSPAAGSTAPADAAAIALEVDPGLVDINTTLSYEDEQAAGTGMVLTASGEVLTNNHVIEGATSISVTDVGNGQTYGATVIGYDVDQDIAVLQLNGASGLQTVSLGNSSNVSVGESVVGIGNAGGTGGTPSYAGGVVTALNQSITASDEGSGTSEELSGLVETDADIQPGDSGGPLVTGSDRVVGMDTAGSAGTQFQPDSGSAYAIPINEAVAIAKQIEAGTASTTVHIGPTAFLGIEVEADTSGGLGGSSGGGDFSPGESQSSGVLASGVLTGDPANLAGISTGDVITSIGGATVESPSALTAALGEYQPGDKVQVGWTDQSGQSHTATVQLASGPPA